MLGSQSFHPGPEGADIVASTLFGPYPTVELIDLGLQLVFAVDQLGPGRPGIEANPPPEVPQHERER